MHHTDQNEDLDAPSRSQQRRDALALLELANQLAAMPSARLARLDLPADVVEEIAHLRRMTAHGARKRQLAYVAKMMRRHEASTFDAVRAAIDKDLNRQYREAAALHRLEALREHLLDDADNTALGQLIERHPDIDRQRLRALIRQARAERNQHGKSHAGRALFRMLRDLPSDETPE